VSKGYEYKILERNCLEKKKHRRKRKEKKINGGLVSCFGRIGVPARSVNFFTLVTNAQLIRFLHFNIAWQLIR